MGAQCFNLRKWMEKKKIMTLVMKGRQKSLNCAGEETNVFPKQIQTRAISMLL